MESLKKVLKGSHIRVGTLDGLLHQNVEQILKSRYPEAVVDFKMGQVIIKKNIIDRLCLDVYKDSNNHVSYITCNYVNISDSMGMVSYYLGLLPHLVLMILQWIFGDNFKRNVYEVLERDLKVKYHTDVQFVEKPMSLIKLILTGLVGLNVLLFLFQSCYFVFNIGIPIICDIINNYTFDYGGIIIHDGAFLFLLPYVNISILWLLFCLFVRYSRCKINNYVYIGYIVFIFISIWLVACSSLVTIESSSKDLVWCTLILTYLLFILSLYLFTKKCKKYGKT